LLASGGSELGSKAADVTLPASAAAKPVLIAEIASIMTIGSGIFIFKYSDYSDLPALSGQTARGSRLKPTGRG
jgi:hypothetical protein